MKTSVKLLLAFATAAAAIAPAAAQQVVAWDEAYRQADARIAQLTLDEKISFMRGYSSFFFYGVPEKGMIAWKAQLQPAEIRALACFLITRQGQGGDTQKAPQGDLWTEEGASPGTVTSAADSATTARN